MLAPIFVVGCPRSGTTLFRNLLRSHPRLTFPSESHFIPSFYRRYGNPATEAAAVDLARRILQLEWVRAWELSMKASDCSGDRTFAAVVDRIYAAWAAGEGKPRWGDKTPHYVAHIPTLLEIFPHAKVLHIVRDGRDVALSWLKTRFEPRNLYTAATLWNDYVRRGLEARQTAPGQVMEVRFEQLVTQPADALKPVCEFIGEAFTESMVTPNLIRRSPNFARRWRGVKVQKPEIISTTAGGWKTSMSLHERSLFEAAAGELLAELGYEVEGFPRRLSAVERACWTVHHRCLWTISRLRVFREPRWFKTALELRRGRALAGR